jgi:hypothetical protein
MVFRDFGLCGVCLAHYPVTDLPVERPTKFDFLYICRVPPPSILSRRTCTASSSAMLYFPAPPLTAAFDVNAENQEHGSGLSSDSHRPLINKPLTQRRSALKPMRLIEAWKTYSCVGDCRSDSSVFLQGLESSRSFRPVFCSVRFALAISSAVAAR